MRGRNNLKTKFLINSIIFILIISLYANTFATTVNELKTKKSETQEELKEVKEELSEEMKKVQEINRAISDNEDKLEELNIKVSSLENEIDQKKIQINEAQEKYELEQEHLKQRLIANYKFGGASYLDVLLNSSDVTNFISNYYYISKIAKSDNQLLDEIEKNKIEIENSKRQLEEKQEEYKEAKNSIEQATQDLKRDKAQKDAYVSKLSSEQKSLQKQIDSYDTEIKKVEEEIRQASIKSSENTSSSNSNSSSSSSSFTSGTMLWPCPSSHYISSYFGGRNTGIPGASTNHKGIDIAANSGAAIVAALDGTVISSAYSSARGNYLIIDHGGGIVTLYQHGKDNTKTVTVGQKVVKGQTIMGVGKTGVGSGNHLHFEVWKNGVPQNPLQSQYLGNY